MKFINNVTEKEYEKLWKNNSNNHFMNSYEWGQAQHETRGYQTYYVGLLDDSDKLVAAALLLKKKTPLKMCYFYCPRGFIIDYNNELYLKEFTNGLKKFLKEENAIYLKLDPPIMYQEIDIDGNIIENGKNNYAIFNNFIDLGYKHCGFNKLYEGNQPRYTFRTYFNKYENFDTIVKNMSSSFTKQLKRSYNYDLEIYENDNIDNFHNLIKIVSNKNGFNEYTHNYYKTIFEKLKMKNYIKIFEAKIKPQHVIEKFTKELETEKIPSKRSKLEKDIEYFKNIENKNEEIVIASLICTYSKSGAWSLYIGNDKIAEYTATVNRLYYEFIKDAYDNKYEFFDLFGVTGDPKTKFKNLAGIYEYKRKFGGEYIEFIGEFDLINKKCWYIILPTLLKIYRTILKIIKK